MSRKEYRVVDKTRAVAVPLHCHSLEEAMRFMEVSGKMATGLKIQVRIVTEWEDA